MLSGSIIERLVPILKKNAKRALKMQIAGFPKPYYCSHLLRDTHWYNTWASSGSVYKRRSDRTRDVYCDIRVGSYKHDQVSNGGLDDNDEELDSASHVGMPIDDNVYEGLKIALWRLTEAKFKEALQAFNQKEALRISTVDPSSRLPSFLKAKRARSVKPSKFEFVNEEKWVRFCKTASKWLSNLPHISSSSVEFEATRESKIFVSTEGSLVVQHTQVFTLSASLRKLDQDGSFIEQDIVLNCATQRELPDLAGFKQMALEKHSRLLNLLKSKKLHSFTGPVLLFPGPAGLLFHEAIGHRLEGSRLLASGEGQTLKDQTEKPILNVELSIRDNPKQKEFNGIRCLGAYDYDDEGVAAKDTLVVKDGVLKEFLNTRSPLNKNPYHPNGHARNSRDQRPISRMGVTIIEGRRALAMESLRELLLAEIKRQKKPFGLIVYETSGGETETTRYDFQAFYGDISYATLLYPDGKEVPVRGVNFVSTPLQALSNIIAVGNEQELENHYCGAESGMIPVTTISPAIVLRNLELQAKDEELVTPFILPRPRS